ncbi:cytochrome P450 [Wolfiporia cocos MD-104 SS10]|uniref:Cytochrome P450 n=1 Tax=Wolfiporia cocos (strain MD-104) TaxID=742152 RepID=A0A2H3K382_WOLCO|nr:cytochrome P450 [Wolfiporia cocos MD-104 SS10]
MALDIVIMASCLLVFATTALLWSFIGHHDDKYILLDNVPGPRSHSFWTGNLGQFLSRHGLDFHREISQDYGPIVKVHGPFGRRLLYVYDPDALYAMLVKDEANFEEGAVYFCSSLISKSGNRLIFGPVTNILSSSGEQHRRQRKLLGPAFSMNRIRELYPIFCNTINRARRTLVSEVASGQHELDMFHWMNRITLEIVGQAALGYSFDPLEVNEADDEYGKAFKHLIPLMQEFFILRPLLPYITALGPAWFRRKLVEMIPIPTVQRLKDVTDVLERKSIEIYQSKLHALAQGDDAMLQQIGEGKDIISVLIRENLRADASDRISEDEVYAQMSMVMVAGADTSAVTVTHLLQLLSEHKGIQQDLRQELLTAMEETEFSYDDLSKLPLLDAVIKETLRLHPPITLLTREVLADTVLPLSTPIHGIDGRTMSSIPVPEGTEIIVGILGFNTDKTRWGEDAHEWKPERWLSPLPREVIDAQNPCVYATIMSFLGGKRSCSGLKFAELSMKVTLSMLLSTFIFEPTGKPITWNIALANYPTTGPESDHAELPLKMGLVGPL